MSENLENRISSTQAKDAIFKAHSIGSSASEIDGAVNSMIKRVDTLADLRSLDTPYQEVFCTGYYTKTDGAFGKNTFLLSGIATTETDNGGTTILVPIGAMVYVYKLQLSGFVNLKVFGAHGDGISDDTNSIASAVRTCIANKYMLWIPVGIFIADYVDFSGMIGLAIYGESKTGSVLMAKSGWQGLKDDSGNEKIFLKINGYSNAITGQTSVTTSRGFSIKNLTIEEKGASQTGTGVYLSSASNFDISEIIISKFEKGMVISESWIGKVACRFTLQKQTALYNGYKGDINNVNFDDCYFTSLPYAGLVYDSDSSCITLKRIFSSSFTNCYFEGAHTYLAKLSNSSKLKIIGGGVEFYGKSLVYLDNTPNSIDLRLTKVHDCILTSSASVLNTYWLNLDGGNFKNLTINGYPRNCKIVNSCDKYHDSAYTSIKMAHELSYNYRHFYVESSYDYKFTAWNTYVSSNFAVNIYGGGVANGAGLNTIRIPKIFTGKQFLIKMSFITNDTYAIPNHSVIWKYSKSSYAINEEITIDTKAFEIDTDNYIRMYFKSINLYALDTTKDYIELSVNCVKFSGGYIKPDANTSVIGLTSLLA